MNLKQRLQLFLADTGTPQSHVAKAIGMSSAVISTYLAGTYKGDVAKLEEKIAAYLTLEENRRADRKLKIDYVRTKSGKRAGDILSLAHVDNQAVVIIGQAGLGKTSALRDYAARYPDVILIEADPTYTAKVLLKSIADKVGSKTDGSLNDMLTGIIEKLTASGRLIAVDEAESLPYRALECLRRIHDRAEVGLALVGMPRLLVNLRGRHGELKQLYSRIGFKLDLGDELESEELAEIAAATLPAADAATIDELVRAAAGNTRRLVKMLHGVNRLSKLHKEPVNIEMVRQFSEMLIH
ncbi:AAA family ATPase [Neisseria sp. S1]|uniref:AAA family ATPase n=1 Tax=Neisseria sp. S1 TaxID=3318354 RepID=UPI003A8A1D94